MPNDTLPDWERVLASAAHLQRILPEEELNLAEYKNLDPRWRNWQTVKAACADYATLIFDRIVGLEE